MRQRRTDEEKQEIVREYDNKEYSIDEIMQRHGFTSKSSLYSLVSKHKKLIQDSPQPKVIKERKERKRKQITPDIAIKIGDSLIERGFDTLRTTHVGAAGFSSFARTEYVSQIVDMLHEIDNEKYGHIKFNPIEIQRTIKSDYTIEEDKIFEDILLGRMAEGYEGKNVPRGAPEEIIKRLKEAGFAERTLSSVRAHAGGIWTNRGGYTNGHFPGRLLHQRNKGLSRELEKRLIEIDTKASSEAGSFKHSNDVLNLVVAPDIGAKRRIDNLKFAGIGHQQLMAYLIDPQNYHRIFGPDFTLLCADFSLENTPEELYSTHKELVERLQMSDVDKDVAHFIDGRSRLDLFFKKENGVYVVAEVKQYATNKFKSNGDPGDMNADRAGQQLFRYKGEILYNILKLNRNLKEGTKLPEEVLGYIVAYEIDEDLQSIVQSQNGRIAVINQQNVFDYLGNPAGQK